MCFHNVVLVLFPQEKDLSTSTITVTETGVYLKFTDHSVGSE